MSVINTSNNTVVATFAASGTTGPGPNLQFTAFTPNGAFGYVASAGFNYVSVIDTSSNTVVAEEPVRAFPVDAGSNSERGICLCYEPE